MQEIVEYWPLLIVAVACLTLAIYGFYIFINKPTDQQLRKVREWLLFAVAQAEKELGSGTGQLKLRFVYDMFLIKFPYLARFISFEMFSKLVDEALDAFEELIKSNERIQDYVQQEG